MNPRTWGAGRAAGNTQKGRSCLGPAWLPPPPRVYLRERPPSTTGEGTDRGDKPGETVGGSAHCIRRQRGGPLGYVVFLRWTPLESPAPAAPGPESAWTLGPHTVSLRPASRPPRGSSSDSAFTLSTVKMSLLRTRKKSKERPSQQSSIHWKEAEDSEREREKTRRMWGWMGS